VPPIWSPSSKTSKKRFYVKSGSASTQACGRMEASEPVVRPSLFKFIIEFGLEAKPLLEVALMEANRE
jgi:hypothetical protein